MRSLVSILLCASCLLSAGQARAQTSFTYSGWDQISCAPSQELRFICGLERPEDLVLIPGTRWLIVSGFSEGAGLKLVNTESKSVRTAFTGRVDRKSASHCPSPPDPKRLNVQGISLRGSTLYATNHGGREAIEIFTFDARNAELIWNDCLVMPGGLAANAVASFSDGTVLVSVLIRPGTAIADFVGGKNTGGLYQWKPGSASGFELIPGTELPGNNGLETAPDDKHFYVVAFGSHAIVEFSRDDPQHSARQAVAPGFMPDNIRWSGNKLIAAGMQLDEPACGGKRKVVDGKADDMRCHRGYTVASLDPASLEFSVLAYGGQNEGFNGVSTGAIVGDELWLASYQANRIAYRQVGAAAQAVSAPTPALAPAPTIAPAPVPSRVAASPPAPMTASALAPAPPSVPIVVSAPVPSRVAASPPAPMTASALAPSSPSAPIVAPPPAIASPPDVLQLDGGLLSGNILPSRVRIYRGVPFAAPPVRDLRWREPQPFPSWQGVYHADRFAPECIQTLRAHDINHYFGEEATSEDCLYLNIWAPPNIERGARAPVVVWIYGGGFTIGSASMANYAGETLARKGVVYVSIAYRLGALGFLGSNYGLLDQIAALQWIRKNIEAFGGDPNNVTIMGQSAGSMSVSILQASPLAHGLFARAVGMSGGAFGESFGRPQPLSAAEENARKFQAALNAVDMTAMRNIPADKILTAQVANSSIRFSPIVDGKVLPQAPQDLFAERQQSDVPLMIGFTRNDINGMELQTHLWAQAQRAHGKAPVFVYTFTRTHPYTPGVTFSDHDPKTVGAYHTADVPYWLGTLESLNLFRHTRDWSDLDRNLSDAMVNNIVNFAKTGNPNNPGRKDWPAYDAKTEKIRELGDVTRTVTWPNRDKLDPSTTNKGRPACKSSCD